MGNSIILREIAADLDRTFHNNFHRKRQVSRCSVVARMRENHLKTHDLWPFTDEILGAFSAPCIQTMRGPRNKRTGSKNIARRSENTP